MAENIQLEIVTPEKSVVSEDAQIVMAPGTLGEFGVLSGHTPFMTSLNLGSVRYVDDSGKERFVLCQRWVCRSPSRSGHHSR